MVKFFPPGNFRKRLRGSALVAGLCFALTNASAADPEFRAAWSDVFHIGMGSPTEVTNMISKLVSGNYNALIVQVLAYMDTNDASHGAYWKSAILPRSSHVTASFD